jgi:crotonobetainyl-CoA:carnitine CoA-transferase CaiB-like acyl-CoA transferase
MTPYSKCPSALRWQVTGAHAAIAVAPYTDKAWGSFLNLVDRAEMLEDPRYATPHERSKHLDQLYQMMIPLIKEKTSAEWLELLEQADVPCSPVQTTEDLVRDEVLNGRTQIMTYYEHPTEGTLRLMRNPVRFTEAPGDVYRLPPNFGAHSREVLSSIGYDQQTLDALVAGGAVYDGGAPRGSAQND